MFFWFREVISRLFCNILRVAQGAASLFLQKILAQQTQIFCVYLLTFFDQEV